MHIHVGFEMIYDSPQPTPIIFNLNVHFTRVSDLLGRDALVVDPPVPVAAYRDGFGNWCTRIVAPTGRTRISADALVRDTRAALGRNNASAPVAEAVSIGCHRDRRVDHQGVTAEEIRHAGEVDIEVENNRRWLRGVVDHFEADVNVHHLSPVSGR